MTGHKVRIPGFKFDQKTGKLVRSYKHLDVSTRLKKQSSKRIRHAKKNQGIGFI